MPGNGRGSTVVQKAPVAAPRAYEGENRDSRGFDEGEFDDDSYYGEGDSEETITEIVGEEVIEIDSDEDLNNLEQQDNEDEAKRINDYLQVDQDQYINDEYANVDAEQKEEQSPSREANFEYGGVNPVISPIAEDQREQDETMGSQGKASYTHSYYSKLYPRQTSGRKTRTKKKLPIWEKERRARKRAAKKAQQNLYAYAPYDLAKMNPEWGKYDVKQARFETDKKLTKSSLWNQSNQSKVPMLSDHLRTSQGYEKNPLLSRDRRISGKSGHSINNVFHESQLQKRLSAGGEKISAPHSHLSFGKDTGRAFMTPLDLQQKQVIESKLPLGSHIADARHRNLHSSSVF